jgi:3-oxoacyl-[acyl-carrier-protein] synthase III
MALRSRVTGVGSYVPPRVITNDDLSELMDTSDEWIVQRTGIRERHWVDADTGTSDLALEASKQALAMADVTPADLDMIFFATLSPDHYFPGSAVFLQRKLGVPGIPAIDVRQQCTGFIYATSMADQYIRTGSAKKVLVVGAEIHSKGLDISDEGRDVSVLFGDGAGATVMEAVDITDPSIESHIFSTHLHADGSFAEELWVPAPGMAVGEQMITYDIIDQKLTVPKMNGRNVYVHAVKRMPQAIQEALQANDTEIDDVDLFVFHQANLRINEAVAQRMGIPDEKVFNTIDRFANTTAATIPIGLHEAVKAGRLEPGMLVASTAFGSGFTWASMLIRW